MLFENSFKSRIETSEINYNRYVVSKFINPPVLTYNNLEDVAIYNLPEYKKNDCVCDTLYTLLFYQIKNLLSLNLVFSPFGMINSKDEKNESFNFSSFNLISDAFRVYHELKDPSETSEGDKLAKFAEKRKSVHEKINSKLETFAVENKIWEDIKKKNLKEINTNTIQTERKNYQFFSKNFEIENAVNSEKGPASFLREYMESIYNEIHEIVSEKETEKERSKKPISAKGQIDFDIWITFLFFLSELSKFNVIVENDGVFSTEYPGFTVLGNEINLGNLWNSLFEFTERIILYPSILFGVVPGKKLFKKEIFEEPFFYNFNGKASYELISILMNVGNHYTAFIKLKVEKKKTEWFYYDDNSKGKSIVFKVKELINMKNIGNRLFSFNSIGEAEKKKTTVEKIVQILNNQEIINVIFLFIKIK